MSWLTPIGFLGLIGLIVLLIIYLIKPNYQNKQISSTFVWKLSLKYRKKKLPISKLRNILLVICQCLIITACAFILAQPFIDGDDLDADKEKVIIIDASGSMRADIEGETRFERAVAMATEQVEEVLSRGGKVSVILADMDPSFIVQRLDAESKNDILNELAFLTDTNDFKCSYGAADIDGAMQMAEMILEENPKTEVILYTATEYVDKGKVTVKDVTDPGEWNVAILDVRAVPDQNFYRFEVDAGSYSRGHNLRLYLEIHGAAAVGDLGDNGAQKGDVITLYYDVILEQNESKTITFGQNELDSYPGLKIYEYDYVFCYVQEKDSLSIDNSFYLYGGKAQPLKIQYYSTKTNNFVGGVLMGLREQLKHDWDIQIDEIRDNEMNVDAGKGKEPELTGYDIYIFEHHMPKTLPTDGLVIMINPDKLPSEADIQLGEQRKYGGEKALNAGEVPAEILKHANASNITITQYRQIKAFDGAYTPFLFVDEEPIALIRNESACKIMVFTFSLHFSNLAMTPEFPVIMRNAVEQFIPTTFEKDVYNVYDKVDLNSRSPMLNVSGPTMAEIFEEFPASIYANDPGLYTVSQTPISGIQVVENFFVTMPDEQSNIDPLEDRLTNPYYPPVEANPDMDMVFYFALALVLLGFAEWWLKSRDHI
jgi:hypothetical protein